MSKKALLIGINYRGTNSALNGCINDVGNIHNFLKEEFKLQNNEIRILTEDHSQKPTKNNILDGFDWLSKNAKPGDKLFLHYRVMGLS